MSRRDDEQSDPGAVHPATTLNEVVHQRARLGILTVLAECKRADFSYLRSVLHLTDGNLGRHLEVLSGDGLVVITKGYEGRRPRTWIEITHQGELALAAQITAMRKIIERFDAPVPRRRGRAPAKD